MQALKILETCLYADDLAAAEQFYREVLGLAVVSRQEPRHVFFRCGESMLLIFNAAASSLPSNDVPPHGARGAAHVAFGVGGSQLADWEARLAKHHVEIEKRVTWPNGSVSLYFRDPAGNSVELTSPRLWGIAEHRLELTTRRLLLRSYREQDRDAFIELNCDSAVRMHMNGALSRESAAALFARLGDGGSFAWAIIEQASGDYIGHAFIDADSEDGRAELGFLFRQDSWGRGFATETACRIVEFTFEGTELPELVATVDCDHVASIRVLEKAGFVQRATRTDEHGPYYVYAVTR